MNVALPGLFSYSFFLRPLEVYPFLSIMLSELSQKIYCCRVTEYTAENFRVVQHSMLL